MSIQDQLKDPDFIVFAADSDFRATRHNFGSLVRGLRQHVLASAPDGIDRGLTASTILGGDPVKPSAQKDSVRPLRREPRKQAFRIGTRTCLSSMDSQTDLRKTRGSCPDDIVDLDPT